MPFSKQPRVWKIGCSSATPPAVCDNNQSGEKHAVALHNNKNKIMIIIILIIIKITLYSRHASLIKFMHFFLQYEGLQLAENKPQDATGRKQ